MESTKVNKQNEQQDKKKDQHIDSSSRTKSLTPGDAGSNGLPPNANLIQRMQALPVNERPEGLRPNIIQRMQALPENERPAYFQPNIIQRMQALPENERPAYFQPNIIQRLQALPENERPEGLRPNILQRMQALPENERPEGLRPNLIQRLQRKQQEEHEMQLKKNEEEKPAQLKQDEEELLQAKFQSETNPEPAPIQMKTGSGSKMPEDVQSKMESSFNTDFSDVNIHSNSDSAPALNALAYTQGNDVHFAPGQYDPGSNKGQQLLGHELAHVVQQKEGRVQPTTQLKGAGINDSEELEKEADDAGKLAAEGKEITSTKTNQITPIYFNVPELSSSLNFGVGIPSKNTPESIINFAGDVRYVQNKLKEIGLLSETDFIKEYVISTEKKINENENENENRTPLDNSEKTKIEKNNEDRPGTILSIDELLMMKKFGKIGIGEQIKSSSFPATIKAILVFQEEIKKGTKDGRIDLGKTADLLHASTKESVKTARDKFTIEKNQKLEEQKKLEKEKKQNDAKSKLEAEKEAKRLAEEKVAQEKLKNEPTDDDNLEKIYDKHDGDITKIGTEMALYAKYNPDLVMKMIDHLATWKEDNLAYNVTSKLKDTDLAVIDNRLLTKLQYDLSWGSVSDLEKVQINRLKKYLDAKPEVKVESKSGEFKASYIGKTFTINNPDARIRNADLTEQKDDKGKVKVIPKGTKIEITDTKIDGTEAFILAKNYGWTSRKNVEGQMVNETLGITKAKFESTDPKHKTIGDPEASIRSAGPKYDPIKGSKINQGNYVIIKEESSDTNPKGKYVRVSSVIKDKNNKYIEDKSLGWTAKTNLVDGWANFKDYTAEWQKGSYIGQTDVVNIIGTSGVEQISLKTLEQFYILQRAATKDGLDLKIGDGFRQFSKQQDLWDKNPNSAEVARPGKSNHQHGQALDLNTGGFNTPLYNWLKTNGPTYGWLRTVKKEHWHWEYRPADAKKFGYKLPEVNP